MEEVKKYIPGDLICWNNALCKVTSIERGLISEVVFEDGHRVNIGPIGRTHIKSIPLTASILEANGWEKNEYGVYYKNFNHRKVICLTKEDGDNWEVSTGGVTLIQCKFIHQLQHLLFDLGLPSDLKV